MSLLILSGLLDHRNLQYAVDFGKKIRVWIWQRQEQMIYFDNMNVLIMVILPIGVKYLLFQVFIIFCISTICLEKLISVQSNKSTEKNKPSILNSVVSQFRFNLNSFSLQRFFFPIHTTWVFSVFAQRSETEPNISNTFKPACGD